MNHIRIFFSKLLTYADKIKQEVYKYTSMKVYTSGNKDRPNTLEEKGRRTSFHTILVECIAEIELISNIINTSWI